MRRGRNAAALVACVAAAFVTPVGGRAISRACAASAVHIAIIVDSGSGNSVSAWCVPAGAHDNGAMLLAERASMLGTPQPRYNASGLLCAIDGFPAGGCGEPRNGHYAYWSYWRGEDGAWSYASVGPASTRVDPNVVEGWRWEAAGAASPADPPPRVAPDASAVCKPTPPPAPSTTAATTRTTVRATVRPAGSATPATIATPGARAVGGDPGTVTTVRPKPATTPGGAPGGTRRASSATSAPPRPSKTTGASASAPSTIGLTQRGISAPGGSSGSGGVPVGLVVGGVLVASLFTAGALAARRRRSTA